MSAVDAQPGQVFDLQTINAMDRAAFVNALGHTFEHSPWVSAQAWSAKPFSDIDELHAAMVNVVKSAPHVQQISFLRMHPELAGPESRAGTLASDSKSEQDSVGLDALSSEDSDQLAQLNAEYRRQHGFPFIIAARDHTKASILAELQRRTNLDTDVELIEALNQVAAITRYRVRAIVRDSSPAATPNSGDDRTNSRENYPGMVQENQRTC